MRPSLPNVEARLRDYDPELRLRWLPEMLARKEFAFPNEPAENEDLHHWVLCRAQSVDARLGGGLTAVVKRDVPLFHVTADDGLFRPADDRLLYAVREADTYMFPLPNPDQAHRDLRRAMKRHAFRRRALLRDYAQDLFRRYRRMLKE